MVFAEKRLQFLVRIDKPTPLFARALQQAIGGVEGEIRVMMQYLFQAWGARGPMNYRDMLLDTGTEEIGHIEMLSTAVALDLENAPLSFQEEAAADSIDGKGEFSAMMSAPLGEVPTLAPARPNGFAQRGQMSADPALSAQMPAGSQTGLPSGPAGVL